MTGRSVTRPAGHAHMVLTRNSLGAPPPIWLLMLALGLARACEPGCVRMPILQRMSDTRILTAEACGDGETWVPADAGSDQEGTCWLGSSWQAVAVAGIAAVRDFNERAVTYVPALADLEGCDKQLSINLLDSGSTGLSALEQLARPLFNPVNGTDVHAVIGPSRSAASLATASITGIWDTPQISYWATSTDLDKTSRYQPAHRIDHGHAGNGSDFLPSCVQVPLLHAHDPDRRSTRQSSLQVLE